MNKMNKRIKDEQDKMNKKMNGDGRYEFNLLYSINMLGK